MQRLFRTVLLAPLRLQRLDNTHIAQFRRLGKGIFAVGRFEHGEMLPECSAQALPKRLQEEAVAPAIGYESSTNPLPD